MSENVKPGTCELHYLLPYKSFSNVITSYSSLELSLSDDACTGAAAGAVAGGVANCWFAWISATASISLCAGGGAVVVELVVVDGEAADGWVVVAAAALDEDATTEEVWRSSTHLGGGIIIRSWYCDSLERLLVVADVESEVDDEVFAAVAVAAAFALDAAVAAQAAVAFALDAANAAAAPVTDDDTAVAGKVKE